MVEKIEQVIDSYLEDLGGELDQLDSQVLAENIALHLERGQK